MEVTRRSEKGSALIYILIAIALLAALTATFMNSSSQQTSSQSTFNTVTDLNTQINFIRSAIQECVLTYPDGDPAMTAAQAQNIPYPIHPDNAYLAASTPAVASGSRDVALIGCPGNPGATANAHKRIFGGSSGKFLPPPPKLFGAWQYYNGTDGVFISIATDKTDAFLKTALAKLDDQFSECEADVVDATSGVVAMSSDGTATPCPLGSTCFRIRLITTPTATYLGDTDGDEGPSQANCPH